MSIAKENRGQLIDEFQRWMAENNIPLEAGDAEEILRRARRSQRNNALICASFAAAGMPPDEHQQPSDRFVNANRRSNA